MNPNSLFRKYKKIIIALTALILCGFVGGMYMIKSSVSKTTKATTILVPQNMSLTEWMASTTVLEHPSIFKCIAKLKSVHQIKAGYYQIPAGMTNNALVNKFRAGLVDPIGIAIENQKTIYDVCGKLGKKLQVDSAAFADYLTSAANLSRLDTDQYNLIGFIPPNTYNFNYSTTPQEFMDRMLKNYNVFWTSDRIAQAQSMGMKPAEVINLASIVKAETAKNDEAPKIAGLYLNRLRIGMALQSDPTATYGRQMEHVERVTNAHTNVRSAYNTYQFTGLPPGPIGFPEVVYLEAVLQPASHDFIYMCAQPQQTGYHNFSRSYAEHQRYAALYHDWLDANGIR